jgi:hypothetical protein
MKFEVELVPFRFDHRRVRKPIGMDKDPRTVRRLMNVGRDGEAAGQRPPDREIGIDLPAEIRQLHERF